MTIYRGTLTRLIRLRNTRDGGPRWKVHFTVESGVITIELETKPGSTLAHGLTQDWEGRYVEVEVKDGQILKLYEIPPTAAQLRAENEVLRDGLYGPQTNEARERALEHLKRRGLTEAEIEHLDGRGQFHDATSLQKIRSTHNPIRTYTEPPRHPEQEKARVERPNRRQPRNELERELANELDVAAMACGLNATPDQLLFMVQTIVDAQTKMTIKDALTKFLEES